MAFYKTATLAILLATLVLISNTKADTYPPPAAAPLGPPPHKIADPKECVGACGERCSVHSRKNVCSRACLTCCSVCRCVPAGTAGNRETCGTCYTDWTTHGNKTKCP